MHEIAWLISYLIRPQYGPWLILGGFLGVVIVFVKELIPFIINIVNSLPFITDDSKESLIKAIKNIRTWSDRTRYYAGGLLLLSVVIGGTLVFNDWKPVDDVKLTVSQGSSGRVNVLDKARLPANFTEIMGFPSDNNGRVECLANGFCYYTPPPDYAGKDTFTYVVKYDGYRDFTAKVSVIVKAPTPTSTPIASNIRAAILVTPPTSTPTPTLMPTPTNTLSPTHTPTPTPSYTPTPQWPCSVRPGFRINVRIGPGFPIDSPEAIFPSLIQLYEGERFRLLARSIEYADWVQVKVQGVTPRGWMNIVLFDNRGYISCELGGKELPAYIVENLNPVFGPATPTATPTNTPTATSTSTVIVMPTATSTPTPPSVVTTITPSLPGVETIPVTNLAQSIPWLRLDENAIPATYYYGFNINESPFDNRLVRQAFSLAVDRQRIVRTSTRFRPATTFTPPDVLGQDLYGQVGLPFDPNKARTVLALAGYPNGENFPQVALAYMEGQGGNEAIAKSIVSMWHDYLGVDVELQTFDDFKAYSELLETTPPSIYALAWVADYADPDNFLNNTFRLNLVSGGNQFDDIGFNSVVKQAEAKADNPALRQELYIKAERILTEQQAAVIPIFHYYKTK